MQTVEAMEKRREAIVSKAQELLAQEDLGAFSIRKLARSAEVSVATIYNLVGDRNEVLVAIVNHLTEQMRAELDTIEEPSLLSIIEARLNKLLDFTESRETLLRSANLAFDQLSRDSAWNSDTAKIIAESEASYVDILLQGVKAGDLRGDLSARDLGELLWRVYLDATMDWAYRRISFKQYRNRAARNSLTVLAADATEAFRSQLLDRIAFYADA